MGCTVFLLHSWSLPNPEYYTLRYADGPQLYITEQVSAGRSRSVEASLCSAPPKETMLFTSLTLSSSHPLGRAASAGTRWTSPCSPLPAGTPLHLLRAQGLKRTVEVLCQETSSRRRGPNWRVSVPAPLETPGSSCWLNSLCNFISVTLFCLCSPDSQWH